MPSNHREKEIIARGPLRTTVDLTPFDTLEVRSSWGKVPNKIWISEFNSLSPVVSVGLPEDSEKRQTVLKILQTAISSTETGVGNIEDLVSLLSLVGMTVDPRVSSVLTITGFGTRFAKNVEIKGVVHRGKIVAVDCSECGSTNDFIAWNKQEAQNKTEFCPDCGSKIDSKNKYVF